MAPQQAGEVGRTRFLLAFEHDLEIEGRRPALGPQRIDRGEYCHHARFVVGSAARIEPPVVADRRIILGQLQRGAGGAGWAGQQPRREGRRHPPVRRGCRLPVIMGVNHIGPCRARNLPFAVDQRRRLPVLALEQPRGEAAPRHHRDDKLGVAPDIVAVRGDVRDGEQLDIFAQQLGAMLAHPILGRGDRRRRSQDQQRGDQAHGQGLPRRQGSVNLAGRRCFAPSAAAAPLGRPCGRPGIG